MITSEPTLTICSACISVLFRLAATVELGKSEDASYLSWKQGVWAYPEGAVGIVVACVPAFPRFVSHIRDSKPLTRVWSSLSALLDTMKSNQRSDNDLTSLESLKHNHKDYVGWPAQGRSVSSDAAPADKRPITPNIEAEQGMKSRHWNAVGILRTVDVEASAESANSYQDRHVSQWATCAGQGGR